MDRDREGTLDPDDWARARATGHAILDELFEYLRTVRERPVWRVPPPEVKARLLEPAPAGPQPLDELWKSVRDIVLAYPTGNIHPRFFGWVHGSGTIGGMLAELVAGAVNANLGGRDHAPVYVERQVLDWAKQILGWPADASGILLTGTSMANVVGLCVARNAADARVRAHGLPAGASRWRVYTSTEAHVAVRKALELLGLGGDALRPVAVGDAYAIDVAALRGAIAEDRAAGYRPICVVGTAGTVNTGAMDDLYALADVAAEEGVWFHVDGAFGALVALSDDLRPLVRGIERADSLAFDFHKWLHVPYAVGCLLVRDEAAHRAAFTTHESYLANRQRGLAAGAPWFCDYGPELSRGFLALKVWLTIQEHGLRRLAAMIEKNCAQAQYLAELVRREPRLELAAPVTLNIVCFRYRAPGLDGEALNRFHEGLVADLHDDGVVAPSTTTLGGSLVIRANLTNHRTLRGDLDVFVHTVVATGDRLMGAAAAR